MAKKKDDDLMFGDRLQPGPPTPPPPGPLPPGPHPAPGPIPPPPPPGLPTYPTCQFIEDRFQALRNEHTGLKNAILDTKTVVDENKALLSDVASIATNGFASTTTNISNAKTDTLQAVAGVEGKVNTAITDIGKVDDKVAAGFDGKSLTSVQGAIAEQVTTRSDAIDEANGKIWDRIGHTEGAPTIESAIKTTYDKIGHEQERTIEKLVQEETDALDDAVRALHEKVGTSTSPNGVGETTIEGTILAAHGFEIQSITGAQSDIKVKIDTEHTTTRNHITTKADALTNTVNEAKADIRSALGLSSTQEHSGRNSLWDKVNGVETKVDTVDAVADRIEGKANSISIDTTAVRSAIDGQTGIVATVSKINTDINQEETGVKALIRANGTALSGISTAVESIGDEVSDILGTLGDRGQDVTVYAKLANVGTTLNQVKASVDAISTEEAEQALTTIDGKVDGLTTGLADVKTTLGSDAAGLVKKSNDTYTRIKSIQDTLEMSSTGMRDVLGFAKTSIGNIEDALGERGAGATVFQRLDDLAAAVSAQAAGIQALASSVTTLTEVVSNLLVAVTGNTPESQDGGNGGGEEEPVEP